MSGVDLAASRRTRSPSASSSADSPSTVNSTLTSTPGSSPGHSVLRPRRPSEEERRFQPGRPTLLRLPSISLPSFQELDEGRPRSMDVDMTRQRAAVPQARIETRQPSTTVRNVIDLTGDDEVIHRRPAEQVRQEEVARLRMENPFGLIPRPDRSDRRPLLGHAQRGPRFPAEIIDLSGDTPQRHPQRPQRAGERDLRQSPPTSPEITFLRARPRAPPERFDAAAPPAPRVPNRLNLAGQIAPIEIPDDDEDIQIIRERHTERADMPGAPPVHAEIGHGLIPRHGIADGIVNFMANFGRGGILATARARQAEAARRRIQERHINFITPAMDFGMAAFDLGYHGAEPPTPEREPSVVPILEPPPEGFTRSPAEEDVLICPACDAELSVGDDDVKRQVWLVKKCGHVSLIFQCICDVIKANGMNRSTAANVQQAGISALPRRARRGRIRRHRSRNALWWDATRKQRASRWCSSSCELASSKGLESHHVFYTSADVYVQ